MPLSARTIALLALTVVGIMLALFVVKAALAAAIIVGAVFAGLYVWNFVRALTRRLSLRAARQTIPRALR